MHLNFPANKYKENYHTALHRVFLQTLIKPLKLLPWVQLWTLHTVKIHSHPPTPDTYLLRYPSFSC